MDATTNGFDREREQLFRRLLMDAHERVLTVVRETNRFREQVADRLSEIEEEHGVASGALADGLKEELSEHTEALLELQGQYVKDLTNAFGLDLFAPVISKRLTPMTKGDDARYGPWGSPFVWTKGSRHGDSDEVPRADPDQDAVGRAYAEPGDGHLGG